MVALEGLLAAPRELRWCHRDLFSDNVRATRDGGVVVFDFDNSGPCDPAWEVAFALVEFATTEGIGDAGVDRPGRGRCTTHTGTGADRPARGTRPSSR